MQELADATHSVFDQAEAILNDTLPDKAGRLEALAATAPPELRGLVLQYNEAITVQENANEFRG